MSDPRSGMPIAVLLDYDGTISLRDIGDQLMTRLGTDQQAVAAMDARYVAGEIGSRDLISWNMDMLPRDPVLLREVASTIPQDPGIVDLVALCRSRGIAVEVVSDGLGFYIESNLGRLGIDDVPIYTNRNLVQGGGDGVSFPFGHPVCRVCGTCKRERVRAHADAGRLVIFVGDGPSDRYAAWHADVTFAKDSLREWCESAGVETVAWESLADVIAWMEHGITTGALPNDLDAVREWRSAQPLRDPPFICGPEAGMTTTPAPMDPEAVAGLP